MFDLGWTELLVIGVVALIVVGPKDLPVLFRKAGQFIGKAKGMAREFSQAMDQAADESGVKDVSKTLNTITNPIKSSLDGVNEAANSFKDWSPDFEAGGLSSDRAEAAEKIHSATAKKAGVRQAAEKTHETVPVAAPGSGPVSAAQTDGDPAAAKATDTVAKKVQQTTAAATSKQLAKQAAKKTVKKTTAKTVNKSVKKAAATAAKTSVLPVAAQAATGSTADSTAADHPAPPTAEEKT